MRARAGYASVTSELPSNRTFTSISPWPSIGTLPWSESITRTLPACFGNGESAGRIDTWVVKPVVAPQSRSKTTTFHVPPGALNSSNAEFSQGELEERDHGQEQKDEAA